MQWSAPASRAIAAFSSDETVVMEDEPMASLYTPAERALHSNVVKL